MTHRRIPALALLAAVCLISACSRTREADPHMVSGWMHRLYGAIRAERLSPNVASRLSAYATGALYSGIAAATPGLPTLDGKLNGLATLPKGESGATYDPTIAAVSAERVIVDSLFRDGLPTTKASLTQFADSLLTARIAEGLNEDVRARSADLGRRTGLAIVAWAHGDGFDSTRGRKYVPPVGPGLWVNDSTTTTYTTQNISGVSQLIVPGNPTNAAPSGSASDRGLILDRQKRPGPTTMPATNMAGVTEAYWGHNRPFVLTTWRECPLPPPPAFSLTPGAGLYGEAKAVHDISKALTPAQKATALYWADNGGETGTPVGHWLSIASQMVSERKLNGAQAAWLMVLTSASMADAFIATWGVKFEVNVIRPRTYIRMTMDSTWEPAIPTPPFPEYVSGHSTVSAAAAATLAGILGDGPFADSTSVPLGHEVRNFASFSAASDEAGRSRIYGGIHYPVSNVKGAEMGRCIAGKVLDKFGGGKLPAGR
ncbi:MAG: vanadium-dependent haloperoxidase [Gemmatimonadota bacterium]